MAEIIKLHVKKGDMVVVLSGKDKGKKGKVIEALPKKGKVVVEGVNKVKRHTKASQKLPQAGFWSRNPRLVRQKSCWFVRPVINRPA